MGIDFSRE